MARFESSKYLTIIWIILTSLSIITAAIGYFEMSGVYVVGFVLLTVIVKGQLIIDYYMGLKHVRAHWRLAMSGFVFVIPGIIFAGYLIAGDLI